VASSSRPSIRRRAGRQAHGRAAAPARARRQGGGRIEGRRQAPLLSGTDKQEADLKPAGDKLEASGSFKIGPGTKAVAVAVITVAGKPATARFTLT
jgi:hypothetical protein